MGGGFYKQVTHYGGYKESRRMKAKQNRPFDEPFFDPISHCLTDTEIAA